MKKLFISLLSIYSFCSLQAEDLGYIENGTFIAPKLAIQLPVDDTWTVGVGNEGDVPPLSHRISDDQALTVMFMNDPNQLSGLEYSKRFKSDLSQMANFEQLKEITKFDTKQHLSGYEYAIEGDDNGLKYRYGITHIRTKKGIFTAISVTEASESTEYITKALGLLKSIRFNPEILPEPMNAPIQNQSLSYKLGEYTVYILIGLAALGAFKRVMTKKSKSSR
jgi:hypothetical protein